MKQVLTLLGFLAFTANIQAQFPRSIKEAAGSLSGSGASGLSNEEVVAGLKEALGTGAAASVSKGSALDGFWKDERIRIPFPAEAEKMKTTLNGMGMTKQVEEFEVTMNRAAEEAAKEAFPVLRDAITSMSVEDGFKILRGGDQAATNFLRERTGPALIERFRPIVEQATRKVALTSYWTPLTKAYNKTGMLTGAKAVDPDLDGYVTQKAIDGLFVLIAEEEARIRKDPMARTTDLLKRVFAAP
jgi:hypothetical protein